MVRRSKKFVFHTMLSTMLMYVGYSDSNYCQEATNQASAQRAESSDWASDPSSVLQHLFQEWRRYQVELTKRKANCDVTATVLHAMADSIRGVREVRRGVRRFQTDGKSYLRTGYDDAGTLLGVRGRNPKYFFEAGRENPSEFLAIKGVTFHENHRYANMLVERVEEYYGFIALAMGVAAASTPWVLLSEQADRIIVKKVDVLTENDAHLIVLELSMSGLKRMVDPHPAFSGIEYWIDLDRYEGRLVVSPELAWLPVREEFLRERRTGNQHVVSRISGEWSYEVVNGFPLVKTYRFYGQPLPEQADRWLRWEIESIQRTFSEPANDVFFLSHYGLPEPDGPIRRSPNRLWLWALLLGVLLTVASVLIRRVFHRPTFSD